MIPPVPGESTQKTGGRTAAKSVDMMNLRQVIAGHTPAPAYIALLVFSVGLLCGYSLSNRIHIEAAITPGKAEASAELPDTEDLQQQMAQLRAIGYLGDADTNLDRTGVVHFESDRVQPGPSLYNPSHEAEAYLIDLDGKVLHRWALPLEIAFPNGSRPNETTRYWRRVKLLDDGGLLAIYEGIGVVRIDRDSKLIWANRNHAHHDFDFTRDGKLAVLRRDVHVNPTIHPTEAVLEDFIELIDPETGASIETFSIYGAFDNSAYASAILGRAKSGDIFHTNTLQVLDGTHADDIPAFASGNYLISLHSLSLIAVIDAGTRQVVWSLAGQWEAQHEPQLLDNGNLLIFDNRGHGDWSKVIEIDPRSQEIRWGYYGSPENDFFSLSLGSQQRLANGNTLITETNAGRVREITPNGDEVWRFHSPHVVPADDPEKPWATARICEMLRVEPDHAFVSSLL